MKSSIGMERLYYLGDYRNIKVSSYISGIDHEVRLNQELMDDLRYLQMVEVEKTYYAYRLLARDIAEENDNDRERLEVLKEFELDLLSSIRLSISVEETNAEELEETDGSENG